MGMGMRMRIRIRIAASGGGGVVRDPPREVPKGSEATRGVLVSPAHGRRPTPDGRRRARERKLRRLDAKTGKLWVPVP
jgi:hypothetical protein